METRIKKQKKKILTMTSGGFVIAVSNKSLNDIKYYSLDPTY